MSHRKKVESPWTNKICKQMELAGAYVQAIVGSRMSPRGWPDRWVTWAAGPTLSPPRNAWRGHLEFKYADNPCEPLQKVRIREINKRCPLTALVVRLLDGGGTTIENEEGDVLAEWDGTGPNLMYVIGELYAMGSDEASR